jgi:alkylated DNA repair dioxygenase AlkB
VARALPLFGVDTPPGFLFQPDFISADEEVQLLTHLNAVEYSAFTMRGVTARRRVKDFGFRYSLDSRAISEGPPVPPFLLPLREKAATLAGVDAAALAEALIIEYQPGATIGWHRDAPPFGVIVGISLGSACTFKLRPYGVARAKAIAFELPPRSAYVLDGEARSKWEHSIPAVKRLRYSVTFRTLRQR